MSLRQSLHLFCKIWSIYNSSFGLVSFSWDSTIKLWSVSIMSGESVTIDRRVPIVELCDADTSIVSVAAAIDHEGSAVLIAAGCSDGSFLVWSWNSTEGEMCSNLHRR